MLILTRKPGETVVIGDDVRITVLAVRGSQIKLGIEAPREVRVNREEVLEREAVAGDGAGAPTSGVSHEISRHMPAPQAARDGSGSRSPAPLGGYGRDERSPRGEDRSVHRQDIRRPASHTPSIERFRRRRDERDRGSEAA